jgi:hypothetical protein
MTLEKTNLENSLEDGLEELELEDKLLDITTELVSINNNSLFLERLFSQDAGQWIEIESLCSGIREIETQLEELRELFAACFPERIGTLRVTWLDYPNTTLGEACYMIIFFLEALHWSNVALYSKALFLRKSAQETHPSP